MNGDLTATGWDAILRHKTNLLISQISALQEWVSKSGGGGDLFDKLSAPYYRLLDSLYSDDYPLARAIETSDLLLHLRGPAFDYAAPRLSLLATIFQNVRRQVGSVAYAIANVTKQQTTLPKEVDLGLSAIAKGSLYMGFSLPASPSADEDSALSLLGVEDPLYKATKNAIRSLGVVSQYIQSGASQDDIAKEIVDPKVRDATLAAISRLAPTGRVGIDSVGITGRDIPIGSSGALTIENRKQISQWIEHPVRSREASYFVGVIREIDLDVQRFELRRIVGSQIQDIRCVYPESLEGTAKHLLDKNVRAYGRVERSDDERPRLLEIQTLKSVDAPDTGELELF